MFVNKDIVQLHNLSVLYSAREITPSSRMIYRLKNSKTNEVPMYISIPISYQTLEIVIAYLLFKAKDLYDFSTLFINDIVELLTKYYGGIIELETTSVSTIDLYDNQMIWKKYREKIMKMDFLTINSKNAFLR